MISLSDREATTAALSLPMPAELHALLSNVVDHAADADVLDLTYVVIAEKNDTIDDLAEELGFSPLTNPIDHVRWNARGFQPYWAHLGEHAGWYQLIHPIGDDGFAVILLIDARADSALTAMCEHFTTVTP